MSCTSPEDAFRCFMGTEVEILVVKNCFLGKEEHDQAFRRHYRQVFGLD